MTVMLVACKEKDGTHVRRVFTLDRANLREMMEVAAKMNTVPNMLEGESTHRLLDPKIELLRIDDVGLAAMDLRSSYAARVHITFWDRRLRGREYLARRIAVYWMDKYKLEYLFTSIPKTSAIVIAFARRVGFKDWTEEIGFKHLIFHPHNYLHDANR